MPAPDVAWSAVEGRARAAGPEPVLRTGDDALRVRGLVSDSRAMLAGCLFACVPGATSDGHRFAASAAAAGAAALLVEHPVPVPLPQLVVPSVRAVLGPVGGLLAGDPSAQLQMAAVTGSNGKTTTSALIRSVLDAGGRPTGVVTTVGAQFGDLVR